MKITIISLDNWGFNNHIAEHLSQKGHIVNHINFHSFSYKYPGLLHKAYNFFLKSFRGKNLKHIYYGKEIVKRLEQLNEKQDFILTLKGDFIDPSYLQQFKKYTDKSIAVYNDNIARYPKIKGTLKCFDEVYSFEKEDCLKYGLKFTTNWIYNTTQADNENTKFDFDVFNITTKDRRLPIIQSIARELKSKQLRYKIMVFSKNTATDDTIEYISKKVPLNEVNNYIGNSKSVLDINREGQVGLSFRIFESLGLHKKLITTNSDIVNYDFYNPQNILVVDEKNPTIPASFFETKYIPIPAAIFNKYTLEGWTDAIFFGK